MKWGLFLSLYKKISSKKLFFIKNLKKIIFNLKKKLAGKKLSNQNLKKRRY